jgi:hypothetical protein
MKLALAYSLVAVVSAAVLVKQQSFLSNGMQPDVVAHTLSHVEDEWKAQAATFAECNGTSSTEGCADAPSAFEKSCSTVVAAIIQGSSGDRGVAKEYMQDVCGQSFLSGWHQAQCNALALAVHDDMTADKYLNRNNFNSGKLCGKFWSSFVEKEKARVQQEKADREAAEKKAAEEAAEQERIHQEELKKQAAADEAAAKEAAAKEAEQKKVEEQKRLELEAKVKAAEAEARLAQKKAEAEEIAATAQKKKEEAEAAEKEHTEALANLTAVNKTAPVEASKEIIAPATTNTSDVKQNVTEEAAVEKADTTNGTNITVAAANATK